MKSMMRLFTILFIAALLISACNVPKALTEQEQQQTVQAIAQQTISVLETQNANKPPVANTEPPVIQNTEPPISTPLPPVDTPVQPSATPTNTQISPPTLTPSITPTLTPTKKCNHASFVTDVTIPDGTTMAGNTTFTKTWRLKNVGSCTWTNNYALVFDSGDNSLGYTSPVFLAGNVAPEQTVDISINLKAPSTSGTYTANFKLRDNNGVLFGLKPTADAPFWVKINVAAPGEFRAYDFIEHACEATWSSGAGTLPCPGADNDNRGFVIKYATPKWETDRTDNEAGLETHPQWVDNGEIAGKYPAFRVQSGDRFKAVVGCMYGGTSCNVKFFLNYSIGGGMEGNLSSWVQTYDGVLTDINVDLSPLAGSDVSFILRVSANGPSTQDWALWLQPRIMR